MKNFKFLFIVTFSLLINLLCHAQNLVPNPSFENYSQCPYAVNQVDFAVGWQKSFTNNNPTYHTDYLNACSTNGLYQTPSNLWGYQVPFTGNAYMAQVTMAPSVSTDCRENIFIQLTSNLIIGNTYTVSFKASLTDNSRYATNNLGVKFSTVPSFPINNISHVYSSNVITDTQNWVTVSGSFLADSAYQYIGIGNFFTDANTIQTTPCPGCSLNHQAYYIDEISVTCSIPINFTGNLSICKGDSTTISVSPATSYQWSGGSNATTQSITVSPAVDTKYYINLSNGSCPGFDSITVKVIPKPVANITGDSIICQGESTTLSASGGSSYQWSRGTTAVTSSISISPGTDTQYYVAVSNANCSSKDSITVKVNSLPITNISNDTTVCSGASLTLTASGGLSYQWNGGATGTTPSVTVSPGSTNTYYVSTSNGTCSKTDSVQVIVNLNPSITITGDTSICSGESTSLLASGGTTYQWAGGSTASTPGIIVFPVSDTRYYVTATSGTCNAIDSITVKVSNPPVTTVSKDTIVCSGMPVTLTASGGIFYQWSGGSNATTQSITVNPKIQTIYYVTASNNGCTGNTTQAIIDILPFVQISAGPDITINPGESTNLNVTGGSSNNYNWYPSINISCTNCVNPKVSPDSTTTYYVSFIDINGCESLDSVVVYVENDCSELYIPNTFTPDGDGLNDVFSISSVCLQSMELKIFDRWGELIFESTSIADPWTGTYKGSYVQEGVYVYSIKASFISGKFVTKTGGVTVLK